VIVIMTVLINMLMLAPMIISARIGNDPMRCSAVQI
jgi:hypothetical protein